MVGTQELNGLLNTIGNFDPSVFKNDFDRRLIIQKTIYLLQAFGLNIGYRYSWYLRGPYSPELAHTAYAVAEKFDTKLAVQVDGQENERFREFLRFIDNKKNDHYCLEAIASIHFLAKLYGETNEQLIYDEVKQKMRHMSRQDFISLWNELWQNRLLSKKI